MFNVMLSVMGCTSMEGMCIEDICIGSLKGHYAILLERLVFTFRTKKKRKVEAKKNKDQEGEEEVKHV